MASEKKDNSKELFFKDFADRFGESVLSIEMANIEAGDGILNKMGLYLPQGAAALWGLLVFCESKKVYFYVHPSESMMSAMMRVARQGEGPKEQNVCLSDLEGFKVLEPKKHWYDFFDSGAKFRIDAEFMSEGNKIQFTFNTQKKSQEVLPKF